MALTEQALKRSVKAFLENNSHVSISAAEEIEGRAALKLDRPWNDPTLAIHLPEDQAKRRSFVRILNKLWLPTSLSAVYHIDKRKLEVIWTAYRLTPASQQVADRSFKFCLNGETHECYFGEATKSLLDLALYTLPQTAPSQTSHRNLSSIHFYAYAAANERERQGRIDKPLSFFISNLEHDEAKMLNVIRHLNFYMTYYDTLSPQVLVHHADLADDVVERDRYLHGKFPEVISGRDLDSRLLSFWKPQQTSTTLLRFLFGYRILEFTASAYVDEKIRMNLRRIQSSPHLLSDPGRFIETVVEAVEIKKADDIPRLKSLVTDTVEPSLLWSVIEGHKEQFVNPTRFDGGFELPALISDSCGPEAFSLKIHDLTDTLRRIRNAVSHGKDVESGKVIIPSPRNENKLEPWVLLLEIIAGEVILHRDVV